MRNKSEVETAQNSIGGKKWHRNKLFVAERNRVTERKRDRERERVRERERENINETESQRERGKKS